MLFMDLNEFLQLGQLGIKKKIFSKSLILFEDSESWLIQKNWYKIYIYIKE